MCAHLLFTDSENFTVLPLLIPSTGAFLERSKITKLLGYVIPLNKSD